MNSSEKKILVTGASGFVGKALLQELLKIEKYRIYGLLRNPKSRFEKNKSTIEIVPGDISVYETLKEAEKLEGIETVVHCAGLAHQFGRTTKDDFWKVNVQGTENICRLAKSFGARHFILISSVAVYGDYGNIEIEEGFECRPAGDYAESKRASELKAIEFCEKNDLHLTILRLGTVIGEEDSGNMMRLIKVINKNRFIWIGKGGNKKSLIYKNDAARGILKAIETSSSENRTNIYNLTARAESMSEIVDIISKNLQKKPPRLKIPESLARLFLRIGNSGIPLSSLKQLEKTLEKWLSNDVFNGEKFGEEFGFEPETTISEALAREVKFFLQQKNRDSKK